MDNFSSVPDPWDDSANAGPPPESPETNDSENPQKTERDDDLFQGVMINLDELLNNPQGAPQPANVNLTERISKFQPLNIDETDESISQPQQLSQETAAPAPRPDSSKSENSSLEQQLTDPIDETASLLDMPLAELQATFGIRPSTARTPENSPSTEPSPTEAAIPNSPPTPAPSSEQAASHRNGVNPGFDDVLSLEPDPEPAELDPIRAAVKEGYSAAEVNDAVDALSNMFNVGTAKPQQQTISAVESTTVEPTVPASATETHTSPEPATSPDKTSTTSEPDQPESPDPVSLVDALDIRSQLKPEQLTTQLPFPEDDIFTVLGASHSPAPDQTQNVEELLTALGVKREQIVEPADAPAAAKSDADTSSVEPEPPSQTEATAAEATTSLTDTPEAASVVAQVQEPQVQEPESPAIADNAPDVDGPDVSEESAAESRLDAPMSETSSHPAELAQPPESTEAIAPAEPAEPDPTPTAEHPPATETAQPSAELERQLATQLLGLVNQDKTIAEEQTESLAVEDAPELTEEPAPPKASPSPLERRRSQLEAQLEQELQSFWQDAKGTPSTPNLKDLQPILRQSPERSKPSPQPESQPEPSPSEQLSQGNDRDRANVLDRDLTSLFRPQAKIQDDPLKDIRSFLLNQSASAQPKAVPADDPDDLLPEPSELMAPQPRSRPVRISPTLSTRPQSNPETPQPPSRLAELESKLAALEKQVYEPTEVLNPLLPLIAQLLKMKVGTSQEAVRAMATPILDEMILERANQNRTAMAQALAQLIPEAISQEVRNNPKSIAKAIGPEVGAAIKEQIRIERDSISESLGPTIGRAIKTQIEVERDAMVDALYPVIGSTVSRYMGEVLSTINQKVESTLSVDGVTRKVRARIQGVSEAELILRESMPATIQAIFLIHKTSGLVIAEVQPNLEQRLESNMIAGMLTAIRSFVNDCIAQTGEITELNEIEYGDSRIVLEVAGYCYLAIVAKGSLPKPFINQMRQLFARITQHHGRYIEDFEGDMETVPPDIVIALQKLGEEQNERATQQKPRQSSPTALLFLVGLIVALITIPWLYFQVRGWFDQRLARQINTALTELDPVAYTPLVPEVRGKTVSLEGRVPSNTIKERAAAIVAEVAPKKTLENEVQVVTVPPDQAAVATSVQVVASILNREPGVDIKASYSPKEVNVTGSYNTTEAYQTIRQAFETLPGIPEVNYQQLMPQVLQERIYFDTESEAIADAEYRSKILPLAEFLQDNPDMVLRVVGHTDPRGLEANNEDLAQNRAQNVQATLIKTGVDARQLQAVGVLGSPPGISEGQPFWLNRCVRFEIIDGR